MGLKENAPPPEKVIPEKIGSVFAVGGENIIRRYDKDFLIKSPIGIRIRLGKDKFVDEVIADFEILKKYLGKYLPEVYVIPSENKKGRKRFDILQRFVEGNILEKNDLKREEVRRQFEDIVKLNREMERKKGISWDFFGALSLFSARGGRIGNIVLRKDGKLKLIDIGTMRMKKGQQPFIVYLIIKWALRKQNKYIKKLLAD